MKYIYILLFVFISCMAYGQENKGKIILSSGVHFSKTNNGVMPITLQENKKKEKTTGLVPRLAYQWNTRWVSGVLFDYTTSSYTASTRIYIPGANGTIPLWVDVEGGSQQLLYGGFVQFLFVDKERFQVFAEYDGKWGKLTETIDENPSTGWGDMETKTDIFKAGLHIGGRYQFYKGLGVELRIQDLSSYTKTKNKDEQYGRDYSEFKAFDSMWEKVCIGLSYSF